MSILEIKIAFLRIIETNFGSFLISKIFKKEIGWILIEILKREISFLDFKKYLKMKKMMILTKKMII